MKYLVRVVLVAGAAAALGLGCSKKNKLEKAQAFPDSLVGGEVLAVVDGDTIIARDLQVLAYISMVPPDSMKNSKFNNMLLDRIIDRSIFMHEARAAGISAPDSVVDNLMEQFTAHFTTDLATELEKMGLKPVDFRKAIERDLAIRSYVTKKIEPAITVSDADCRAFFDQHEAEFAGVDSVRCSHIILLYQAGSNDTDRAQRHQLLDSLRTRARRGENFAHMAKMYSQDSSAERGGDLGFFARGTMVKEFEDVAFSLKKGQISKVFETQFGLHLVKCTDKKAAAPPNYDLAKPRIENMLKRQALDSELQNRLKRNREAAIIVRNYETGA